MYIVNTSFVVESDVHTRWMELVKDKFIPMLRKEGFADIKFTRVLTNDHTGSFTYSLQVAAADIGQYQRLTRELFDEYLAIAAGLFGDRVMYFTSLLKHVDI